MDETSSGFERALNQMRLGKKVCNTLWNGKGMFVCIQKVDENSKMTRDYLCMGITRPDVFTAYVPWLPSNQDLLRGEWVEFKGIIS